VNIPNEKKLTTDKLAKGRSRKSEIPDLVPPPVKLTEEEIKAKYEDNEDY
jgi:hypothetical protein